MAGDLPVSMRKRLASHGSPHTEAVRQELSSTERNLTILGCRCDGIMCIQSNFVSKLALGIVPRGGNAECDRQRDVINVDRGSRLRRTHRPKISLCSVIGHRRMAYFFGQLLLYTSADTTHVDTGVIIL